MEINTQSELRYRLDGREPQSRHLGYQLKYIVADELTDAFNILPHGWIIVTTDLLPFLRGVIAAGRGDVIEEAKQLIELIKEYGCVQVKSF